MRARRSFAYGVLAAAIALPTAMVGSGVAAAAPGLATQAQARQVATQARAAVTTAVAQAQRQTNKRAPKAGRVSATAITPNPLIDETCGLDATLVLDSSGSIGSDAQNVRNAATDFLAALKDTNSTLRITRFSKTASQLAARAPVNAQTIGPGGSLSNGVAAYPAPNGSTNWQQGFALTEQNDTLTPELVLFVTDGDPTSWGTDGSGGTGQVQQPNIDNSLAQAIPVANSVKGAPNKTRVLMVGVGNGVNNANSRQRMTQVSGPNIVTSAGGLVGKSINDVDVAAFTDFKALGAFLRSVVTSLCGNSVTIQKLAQTSAGTEYVPATGWDMTVKPTVTGGYKWVEPTAPDNTAATRATSGAQGTAAFQWKSNEPSNTTSVKVTESVKNGFTADTYTCQIRAEDGSTKNVTGTITNDDPSFTFSMTSSDVATCQLKNKYNYNPGIKITKTADDDPIRGNALGWNEGYTFAVENTGNTPLTVNKPVDPKCDSITGPTGPGSGDPAPVLKPGDTWNYRCLTHIFVATTTQAVTWDNTVSVTGISPNGVAKTDTDSESVVVKTPRIEVVKTAKKTESGTPIPDGGSVPAGTSVTFIYTVTNTGNDTLKNIVATDDKCSPLVRTSGSGTTLAPAASWVYECEKVINPPSSVSSITNTASVTSNWSNPDNQQQNNGAITDTDKFVVNVNRSASLTVIKSTNPAATNKDFPFTVSGPGVPQPDESFTLNASDEDPDPASRRIELDGPQGGGSAYVITEEAVENWVLTGVECVDADGAEIPANFDAQALTATPTINPEQDVTCTFLNERLPKLTISKQTSPAGSPVDFGFELTTPDDTVNFTLADGESEVKQGLALGDYSVEEDDVPAGWNLDAVTCNGHAFTQTGNKIELELGYGDDVDCQFSNGKIPPAQLTIVKQGNPAQSPDFDFNASGNGLLTPGQPGSDDFVLASGEEKNYDVFPSVGGDTYTVTEGAPPTPPTGESGWELTSVECVKNGDTDAPISGDTATGIVEVELAPTDSAVCTYVNQQLPRLRIVKNAIDPNGEPDDTAFTFTSTGLTPSDPFVLKNSANTQAFTDVSPGAAFTVTEEPAVDWTLTSLECSGQGSDAVDTNPGAGSLEGAVGLQYGDDVVCTFVNTKAPDKAHLFVLKNTDPADASQLFDFTAIGEDLDESFTLAGGDFAGFEIDPGIEGKTYTVTEGPLPSRWNLTELDCVLSTDPETVFDGNLNSRSVDVTIAAGEVAVCVFANQKDAQVTINKVTDEASEQLFDFTAAIDSGDPDPFSLAGGESKSYTGIAPGASVAINETVPSVVPRWQFQSVTCVGGESPSYDDTFVQFTVSAGAEAECTYVNHKVPSASVQIVKSADPADGTSFDFSASGADGGVVPEPGDECDPVVPGQACFSLAPDGAPATKDLTVYPKVGGENFTFTEGSLPEGWNLDDVTCLDNGTPVGSPDRPAQKIDVSIEPGDSLVCTFTDRADASLTIIKSAPDDPALDFDFAWGLDPATFQLADGESRTATGLEPGSVTVTEENIPADWYLDGEEGAHPVCQGGSDPVDYTPENGATVKVLAGEDIVCTFSNFFDYRPSMTLTKSVSEPVVIKGETVDYTYVLKNTGNVVLRPLDQLNGVISDNKCSPVTYDSGGTPPDLNPGDEWTFLCTGYQVNENTTNTATATMKDPLDEELTATDDENVEILTPGMEVRKTANKPTVYPGTAVTFTYELVNTGETDLQNQDAPDDRSAWVTDDKCAPVTYVSGDTGDDKILGVGEVWTYTCATTINQTTTNTATGTTTPLKPGGGPIETPLVDTDEVTVTVIKGDITIVKKATAAGGVEKDGVLLVPRGTTVTYKYDVTSGDATVGMQVLDVVDNKCSPVNYKSGDTNVNGLVDPGETWKYECKKLFDGATSVTNVVVVNAVEPTLGGVSTDTDDAKVTSFSGSIALTKTPSAELVPTGTSVTYTYKVTNDGTVDLTTIQLVDDKCSPVVYRSGDTGDKILAVGETWTYTCQKALTETTKNTADVTGLTPSGGRVGATDTALVQVFNPANLDAKIKIKKSANKTKVKKGGKVVYTYKVSNPGKVALAKVKNNVTDNKCAKVKYIKGDKDKNGLLTSGREGSEFGKEVWTFRCKTKLKKTTVNTGKAKGKGWLDGKIVGPTVTDKDKAKVRVIGTGGGGGGNHPCKPGRGWTTSSGQAAIPKKCRGKG